MLEDIVPPYSLASSLLLFTLSIIVLDHSCQRAFKGSDPIWCFKTHSAYFILLLLSEAQRLIVFLNYLSLTHIELPKVNSYFLELRVSYVIALGLDEVFRSLWNPLTQKWHILSFICITVLYPLPYLALEASEIFPPVIYGSFYCLTQIFFMGTILLLLLTVKRRSIQMIYHSHVSKAVVIYLLIFLTQFGITFVFHWCIHEPRFGDASTLLDCTFKILLPITYLVIVRGEPLDSSGSPAFNAINPKDNV
eukprot:TRINITY_DN4794_c0_g1_i1.p1 TRINITY_DN4794_c0_g1~~TRINITY_DN4794_c0_g1_i1.p1  ORF type:complete len:250 (-),score=36.94 TRINITY_DN4794_c0_g1_i1:101-850(-)